MISVPPYCASPYRYQRRQTRVVYVGDLPLGGTYPIRVQSMTTPDTCDTEATVKQIIRLVEANCEIVRVTAPSIRDAENLKQIKAELKRHGITVPLVADIHFTPNAALIAADYVEKVRINPGNYADRKLFQVKEYTDNEYDAELERLEKAFKPLVLKCKQNGVAMRIGTNHGSLSDRIMNRYGDTPLGMVESALEFVRICETYGFGDLVLSMKASNTQVMIQAYRLLAARMDEVGMDYPFHLGVTEAGDGEDGRIKSAIGTGALLDDGIGDTVRVSLTEDPVAEVPVCYALVKPYNDRLAVGARRAVPLREPRPERVEVRLSDRPSLSLDVPESRNPYEYTRRPTRVVEIDGVRLGGSYPVRVELAPQTPFIDFEALLSEIERLVHPMRQDQPVCEIIQLRAERECDIDSCIALAEGMRARGLAAPLAVKSLSTLPGLTRVLPHAAKLNVLPISHRDPDMWVKHLSELIDATKAAGRSIQWDLGPRTFPAHLSLPPGEGWGEGGMGRTLAGLGETALAIARLCQAHAFESYVMAVEDVEAIPAYRLLAARLAAEAFDVPFTLRTSWLSSEDTLLSASLTLGSLLCDGFGDAIEIVSDLSTTDALRLSYNILQGARRRISKTEFISCPSCGRTQFDLETTTQRIKAKTGHLTGVKIAIMGCIVNGPGEMADADFGYVGAGPGMINLYVSKECVARHIPFHLADHTLIELIKTHGKWVEPT